MIVPECTVPNEGEIPVKQYNVAVFRNLFRFERSEGRIQVTNKRLLFRAAGRSVGGATYFQQEFAIDELAGVEAHSNYKLRLIHIIADILILCSMLAVIIAVGYCVAGILGAPIIIPNSIISTIHDNAVKSSTIKFDEAKREYNKLPPKEKIEQDPPVPESFQPNETVYSTLKIIFSLIGLAVSLAILVFLIRFRNKILLKHSLNFLKRFFLKLVRIGLRPNLVLLIKTKGGSADASPIKIQREKMFLFFRLQTGQTGVETGFSEVMPTAETDSAFKELGAIINDIQKLGDHGVQKWKT